MSEQDGTQKTTLKRPANEDRVRWIVYWRLREQLWRTEPEIDKERQEYLAHRRIIEPDEGQGIYPFKDIHLNRADVEWLLITHENGRGPIDWDDINQRGREGLDLRGADLSHENLSGLSLTKSDFRIAQLEEANLRGAQLQDADFRGAQLQETDLSNAQLQRATLAWAQLEKADLRGAQLQNADLRGAQLEKANLRGAQLQNADLRGAQLQVADLRRAQLQNADLRGARLQGAYLSNAELSYSDHIAPRLADVQWGDTNLAVVDWTQITLLGDEYVGYDKAAVRAYRQLSVALRNQGLNEDAARFAYRAQLMQREVFKSQYKREQYLFSLFLDLLSGYGYKPVRCFIAYLLVIFTFATAYFILGHIVGPVLSPLGSVVFSMTSFHGRGFFPGGIGLDDPLTVLAALEAFVGLLIEVTFIATLTQRLFGK